MTMRHIGFGHFKEGEEPTFVDELPETWGNISSFRALKDDHAFLVTLNWFTLFEPDDSIDVATVDLDLYDVEYVFNREGDTVVRVTNVVQKSEEICAAVIAGRKENTLQYAKSIHDTLLSDSDWTQMSDVSVKKNGAWKVAWDEYRQQVRDFYSNLVARSAVEPDFLTRYEEVNALEFPKPPVVGVVEYKADTLEAYKAKVLIGVENLADWVYSKAVPSSGKLEEYRVAEQESHKYLNNEALPNGNSVASWAAAKQWSLAQAANDILAAADRMRGLLYAIRQARLSTKEAIKAAESQEAVKSIYNQFLATINFVASQL